MSNRYAKVTVMAAALAVVAVSLSWLRGDGVGPTADGPGEGELVRRPARETAWNQIDTTPVLTGSSAGTVHRRQPPLEMQVAWASAVVRAETMGLTESHQLAYKVTRVIYGRVLGDVLHIDTRWDMEATRINLRAKLGRKPTDAEVTAEFPRTVNAVIGRKEILFLDQGRKPDEDQGWKPGEPLVYRCRSGIVGDDPPGHRLEKAEKEIVEIIRCGSYLSPNIGPVDLGFYLRACESVVRARLMKIGKRSAMWKVGAVLHVGSPSKGGEPDPQQQPPPATIAVALDTWRLRAESITNYRALQQGKSSATPQEVKKEYDRLVGSELKVGAEAILFIKSQEDAGEQSTFKLIGILHDDPGNGKPIDQTDAEIRQEIKKGVWRNRYR